MIRVLSVLLISVAAFSTAEEIPINTCYYPDAVDGPSSANLIKKDDGFELEVKFWANEISPNSPLKIKQQGADYNSIKLINVMYPVETPSADKKYAEHKLTVPIPKTEINGDRMQLSLHKVGNDGTETTVWCLMTSVRALNGMKEEVTTMMPMPPYPVVMNSTVN